MTEITEAYDWKGRELRGSDGDAIGNIDEIYLDGQTGRPEWATVHTGLFGSKTHFVPLSGAVPQGERLRVPVTKEQVKDAPSIDPVGQLSQDEEASLFEHYNVRYASEGTVAAQGTPETEQVAPQTAQGAPQTEQAATQTAQGAPQTEQAATQTAQGAPPATDGDTSGADTDDAMTRSEEELRVGTEHVERGRARLRKYVVTEMETRTVPVQREEVRIEREPITEENRDAAISGPAISEQEHEVVLHEDRPVVEKEVVPKERVRIDTETSTGEQEISEELRKERIETDEDAAQR